MIFRSPAEQAVHDQRVMAATDDLNRFVTVARQLVAEHGESYAEVLMASIIADLPEINARALAHIAIWRHAVGSPS